jgi:hypothetical protein
MGGHLLQKNDGTGKGLESRRRSSPRHPIVIRGIHWWRARGRLPLDWPDRLLTFAFWAINVGLFAMVALSILPVGLLQTWASVKYGYWFARSAEFLHGPGMETLRWTRVFGDTLFALGAVAFVVAVARVTLGRASHPDARSSAEPKKAPASTRNAA